MLNHVNGLVLTEVSKYKNVNGMEPRYSEHPSIVLTCPTMALIWLLCPLPFENSDFVLVH